MIEDINQEKAKLIIAPKGAGRLDIFITGILDSLSRSRVQGLIKSGDITVDGQTVKSGLMLSGGESIILNIPEIKPLLIDEILFGGLSKGGKIVIKVEDDKFNYQYL